MLVDLLPEQVRHPRAKPKETWEEFAEDVKRSGPRRPRQNLTALLMDIQAEGGRVVKSEMSLACGFFSHRGLDELDRLLRDAQTRGLLDVRRFPHRFIRAELTAAGRQFLETYLQTGKEPKLKVAAQPTAWVELAQVLAPDGQASYFNLETQAFMWGLGGEMPKASGKGLRVRVRLHVLPHLFPIDRRFGVEQWLTGERPAKYADLGQVKLRDLPLHAVTRLAAPEVLREPSKAWLRKAAS